MQLSPAEQAAGRAAERERAAAGGEGAGPPLLAWPTARAAALGPAWFRRGREEAWGIFESLPTPAGTDETWRFADLKRFELAPYAPAAPPAAADRADALARSAVAADGRRLATAARMVFANDHLLARSWHGPAPAGGPLFLPLLQAAEVAGDLVQHHFMAVPPPLGSAKFAALHRAWVRAGAFLFVPDGAAVQLPVEICHWLAGGGGAIFPHTLIVLGRDSRATVVERFGSLRGDEPGFACGMADFHLGPGARLTYVAVQDFGRAVVALQMQAAVVGRDATATGLGLHLGGRYARTESVSRLGGEGGRSDMLAVTVADGDQEFDQRTLQDHRAARTASDLLYKNALADRARTVFSGLIRVAPDAHRTDAYQKVRNLLLSDEAEANSLPGLEIMADDVRCTHGATSGTLDEEELFYLLSRGIPRAAAQRLLVRGFLQETLRRIGDGDGDGDGDGGGTGHPGDARLAAFLAAALDRRFARPPPA